MTGDINLQAQTRAWLSHSVLHPYVPGYASHLERGRYAPNTRRVYLCCVAHFARWLTQNEVALDAIDESAVTRFVSGHLPHCDCPYPVRRGVHDIEAGLRQLLQMLRGDGTLPPRAVPAGHIVAELARFDAFMRDAGGLAAATREQRRRILGQFLTEAFDTGPIVIASIEPTAIRRFVLPGKASRSAGTIRVMGGAIGCYLRFRALDGDHIDGLRAAIPRAAHWRLASLPDRPDPVVAAMGDPTAPTAAAVTGAVKALHRLMVDVWLKVHAQLDATDKLIENHRKPWTRDEMRILIDQLDETLLHRWAAFNGPASPSALRFRWLSAPLVLSADGDGGAIHRCCSALISPTEGASAGFIRACRRRSADVSRDRPICLE
jgi:integrase/recombinase XerD